MHSRICGRLFELVWPLRCLGNWSLALKQALLPYAFLLVSCASAPTPQADLSGRIDEDMVHAAMSLSQPRGSFVKINSNGGRVDSAAKIVAILRQKGLGIEATGRCLSACASVIFIGVPHRRIASDTLLAFHGSEFGMSYLFSKSEGENIPALSQSTQQLAKLEHDIYVSAEVDPRLLLSSYLRRGPLCYATERSGPYSGSYIIGTTVTAYAPSADTLRSFGVKLTGDNADMSQDDIFSLPENPDVSVATDAHSALTPQQVEARMKEMIVRACQN